MKSIFVCVAVVMSFYSMSSQAKDHQPGFRVMITEKGLNYGIEYASYSYLCS